MLFIFNINCFLIVRYHIYLLQSQFFLKTCIILILFLKEIELPRYLLINLFLYFRPSEITLNK